MPKLLIIEDEPVIRKSLQHIFEEKGYVVCTAIDGLEGVALAREVRPDLVIADILMPVLDGFTAISRITTELPGTPVIAISAAGDQRNRESAIEAGASLFLSKPIDSENIVASVEKLLH